MSSHPWVPEEEALLWMDHLVIAEVQALVDHNVPEDEDEDEDEDSEKDNDEDKIEDKDDDVDECDIPDVYLGNALESCGPFLLWPALLLLVLHHYHVLDAG